MSEKIDDCRAETLPPYPLATFVAMGLALSACGRADGPTTTTAHGGFATSGGASTGAANDGEETRRDVGGESSASSLTSTSGDPQAPGSTSTAGNDSDTQPGEEGPIDEIIAQMPENSWRRLADTQMGEVCPVYSSGHCRAVMSAWGGGAYDTVRDRLIVFGGGHADGAMNNVFAFDLTTATWERHSELPAAMAALGPGDPIPAVFADVRVEPCGYYPSVTELDIPASWISMGSNYVRYEHCSDPALVAQLDPQQPRSPHTYGNLGYSPTTQQFYVLGMIGPWPSGQTRFRGTLGFDFDTRTWSRGDDMLLNAPLGAAATGADGMIYFASYNVDRYDPSTGTWTTISNRFSGSSLYGQAAIDTRRNRLTATRGLVAIETWELDGPDVPYTEVTASGLDEPLGRPGFVYAVELDRFIAWEGGRTMYWLDPESYVWHLAEATGDDPGPSTTNGIFGRFRYSPRRNVIVVATATNEDVFIYKPPADPPDAKK